MYRDQMSFQQDSKVSLCTCRLQTHQIVFILIICNYPEQIVFENIITLSVSQRYIYQMFQNTCTAASLVSLSNGVLRTLLSIINVS